MSKQLNGMKPWNKTAKGKKQSCQESQAVYRMKTGVQGWNSISHDTVGKLVLAAD